MIKDDIENRIRVDEFWNIHLVKMYGVATFSSRKGIICPFHNDVNPSFKVYSKGNLLHCFGCGTTLGVVSSLVRVSKLKGKPMSEDEAINTICELYDIEYEDEQDRDVDFFERHKVGKNIKSESSLESIILRRAKIDKAGFDWGERTVRYADLDIAANVIIENKKV